MLKALEHYRLFGYWLGDGYIRSLTFKTVDRDMMEWCERFEGFKMLSSYQPGKPTQKKVYVFKIDDKSLYNYFIKQTYYKKHLPNGMYKWSKKQQQEFIGGVFDAEGFVARNIRKDKQQPRYTVGFCSVDEWAKNIARYLEKLGCKMWKFEETIKSGKTAYRFSSNVPNFLKCGINFVIRRKQERIEKFLKERKIIFLPCDNLNNKTYKDGKHKCFLCDKYVIDLIIHIKRVHNLSRKEFNILFPNIPLSYKNWKGKGIRIDIGNGDMFFHSSIEANMARILEYYKIKYQYRKEILNVPNLGKYAVPFYLPNLDIYLFINSSSSKTKQKNDLFVKNSKVNKVSINRKEYFTLCSLANKIIPLERVDAMDLRNVQYSEVEEHSEKFLRFLSDKINTPSQT